MSTSAVLRFAHKFEFRSQAFVISHAHQNSKSSTFVYGRYMLKVVMFFDGTIVGLMLSVIGTIVINRVN